MGVREFFVGITLALLVLLALSPLIRKLPPAPGWLGSPVSALYGLLACGYALLAFSPDDLWSLSRLDDWCLYAPLAVIAAILWFRQGRAYKKALVARQERKETAI